MPLQGKIAFVTGASRGIGAAIAQELGNHRATVIGTATTEEGALRITAALKEAAIEGKGVVLDVNDAESVDQALAETRDAYGPVAILVNNAAVTRDNLTLRMRDEEWDSVMSTNLTSVFRLTRACLKDMLRAQWGRIISLGSVVGHTGNPGQANYSAAKAGLLGYSKALAQEVVTRGITVNVVSPGLIDTDMARHLSEAQHEALLNRIPVGRPGKPEEVAHAVAFLASPLAAYITGHTLHVNGGMLME